MIRRVNIEPALLFGAGRALLLQLAHPAVAQGVADHSDFQHNPFRRLQGTIEATYTAVFGPRELARRVGARVQRIHEHVTGPSYRATDPENLLWVHATLVDTALRCYTDLVAPLGGAERERYYGEMTEVGELFGLARRDQPPTIEAFEAYMESMVASLAVSDAGRELAAFILRPQLPLRLHVPLAPPLGLHRLFSAGMTPARLRAGLGIVWTGADEKRYQRARRAVRAAFRISPRSVRIAPNVLGGPVLLWQARRHAA